MGIKYGAYLDIRFYTLFISASFYSAITGCLVEDINIFDIDKNGKKVFVYEELK